MVACSKPRTICSACSGCPSSSVSGMPGAVWSCVLNEAIPTHALNCMLQARHFLVAPSLPYRLVPTNVQGAVWSCVLNKAALLCATGSADFSARLWDACSGNQLHEWQHNHIVRSTAFSSNSNKLATGGEAGLRDLSLKAGPLCMIVASRLAVLPCLDTQMHACN